MIMRLEKERLRVMVSGTRAWRELKIESIKDLGLGLRG